MTNQYDTNMEEKKKKIYKEDIYEPLIQMFCEYGDNILNDIKNYTTAARSCGVLTDDKFYDHMVKIKDYVEWFFLIKGK